MKLAALQSLPAASGAMRSHGRLRAEDRLSLATRLLFVAALAGSATIYVPAAAARSTFVIAPVIEGLMACGASAVGGAEVSANSWCASQGGRASAAVMRLLDELEPGGPRGEVQVGYVLTVQLLSLYRLQGAQWVLDEFKVRQVMELLREVRRPVVIYLAANHFDSQGPLTETLVRDKRNLLQLADGTVPDTNYFGYRVVPYTLLTDESIPVNRLRFGALRELAARIAALSPPVRERIIAVALGGELHHLFPDFDRGMGVFDQPRVTDYSPASVAAFRTWLARKYGDIAALNEVARSDYRAFGEVIAPGRNAFFERDVPHPQHYDGFAGGKVPVHGWLWDPQHRVQKLELLVNGRFQAEIERGFNRLDVYRALSQVDNPNIGFRHDLDVTGWQPGNYRLQVIAHSAQGRHELARRQLIIEGPKVSRIAGGWLRLQALARRLAQGSLQPLSDVEVALDLPRDGQRVLFNPLARDWNEFRAQQVRDFMQAQFTAAREAGLPADKLYSHQILARVNSSWNAELFATGSSLGGALPWKPGFNTYGGAAGSEWIRQFVQEGLLAEYGVPEFHSQQWKKPGAALEALQLHQRLGARFVGPYYLSIVSDREEQSKTVVKALEIRPNNKLEGSDLLYQAIRELASQ